MTATHVLVVDDEPDIRELLGEILVEEGYRVTPAADGATARAVADRDRPELALIDIWMPDVDGITLLKEWQGEGGAPFPVIMISGHGTIETAVEATRFGAYDYVEKPLSLTKLLLTVRGALGGDDQRPPEAAARIARDTRVELVGASRAITDLRQRLARLARSDVAALVRGEAGTGKRTAARLIHDTGGRPSGSFVDIDLSSLSAERGHAALFEADGPLARAGGATAVIHDIALLDAPGQARLSDWLSERGRAQAPRLIALTASDLRQAVEQGTFRSDLYHTLNSAPVRVPPLREHAEDVPELLEYWTNRLVAEEGLTYRHFDVAAQNRLRQYDWPGNVAELVSLVRQLLALGEGVEIGAREVDRALEALRPSVDASATVMPLPLDLPLREARQRFERMYLQRQLQAVGGRIGDLAQRVGMERTHLYRKLRSLGIDYGGRDRG
jgi:DNA-binding NtrC family response regulator